MSETLIILYLIISINTLTTQEASYQENPYRVAEIIGIEEGMIIGEAGAGDGYYSFLFSGLIGNTGHIYTNEINRKLVKAIKEQAPVVKVMVGGAPVTQNYADEIGADGFGEDAPSAVKLTRLFIKEMESKL